MAFQRLINQMAGSCESISAKEMELTTQSAFIMTETTGKGIEQWKLLTRFCRRYCFLF